MTWYKKILDITNLPRAPVYLVMSRLVCAHHISVAPRRDATSSAHANDRLNTIGCFGQLKRKETIKWGHWKQAVRQTTWRGDETRKNLAGISAQPCRGVPLMFEWVIVWNRYFAEIRFACLFVRSCACVGYLVCRVCSSDRLILFEFKEILRVCFFISFENVFEHHRDEFVLPMKA